jgi:hypothetical protein
VNPEEFELLLASQAIFARLARDAEDLKLARCLLEAVTAGRAHATAVLLRCGIASSTDRLRRSARALKDTGSFVNADILERFAVLATTLERRASTRPQKRRSDGAAG